MGIYKYGVTPSSIRAERKPDFKSKLNVAFKQMRESGYFARQNFQCCQSCACAEVPDKKSETYVFYHRQDAQQLKEARQPEDVGVYLAWSGDGAMIKKVFEDAGCSVVWDGSESTRIWVCEPC